MHVLRTNCPMITLPFLPNTPFFTTCLVSLSSFPFAVPLSLRLDCGNDILLDEYFDSKAFQVLSCSDPHSSHKIQTSVSKDDPNITLITLNKNFHPTPGTHHILILVACLVWSLVRINTIDTGKQYRSRKKIKPYTPIPRSPDDFTTPPPRRR